MTSLSTPSRAESTGQRAATWAPLAVILCGTFVYVLDFFVVNVALPSIARGLAASPAAIEWIVAGYGLSSAAFLITGGRLGDHYGRRKMFCAGIAVFTVASALCGAAPDAGFLIAARLAQGIGGAVMAPNVLSILGTTYSGPARVKAISVYGMVMGLAAVGGQLIGGLLISANVAGLGWRLIFLVNVPVGIAALALARRLVPESRAARPGRLDLRGAALLTAALVAILLPLLDGRAHGWPAWSWACLAAGPVILGLFAVHLRQTARHAGHPLLDPAIFAVRAFRAGVACQLLFYCQTAAGYLLLALYLQEGRGLSPMKAGGVFAVLAAGFIATSFRAPALTMRFGRRVVATGALLAALGNVLLILAVLPGTPLVALFPGLFLLGAGQGLCLTPLTTTVLSHAERARCRARKGNTSLMATTLLNIGEFSRMTHLSVKALRHYHDMGVLEPALIDPHSGYRSYGADQVTSAQVIRRLRDLGMPLDSIRAVLLAPDLAARNREITAHLERMERQLEQTQAAVSGLRSLLGGPAPRPDIQFRTIPAVTALAVAAMVTTADVMTWAGEVSAELTETLRVTGLIPAGPLGALFPGEFFELERSEITLFTPVEPPPASPRLGAGRVRLTSIAGIEAAVAVHDGPAEDVDRTYGALGTAVAERAIGVDGPIREYYPDGFDAAEPHRTEICWPVFLTGALPGQQNQANK